MIDGAAIVRSRTLQLPQALDANVATTLIDSLSRCHDEDVVIDASHVQRLTTQCAQMLRAAAQNWKSNCRSLTLISGAVDFSEYLQAA